MKKIFILILILFCTLSIQAGDVITLAVEDGWEPYANADGTGMSNKLVIAAYRAVGIEVHLVVRPYARLLDEVKAGKWIGGFNVALEDSTRGQFTFGKEMLFLAKADYYMNTTRPLAAKSAEQLINGERIGVIYGYEYGGQFFKNSRIVKEWVTRHDHNIQKLLAGRIDAAIFFEKTANLLLKDQISSGRIKRAFPSEPSRIYVAFSKKHPGVQYYLQKLDEGLRLIKANGVYAKICSGY